MNSYAQLVCIGRGDGTRVGPLTRVNGTAVTPLEKLIAADLRGKTLQHPCIGARAVFGSGNMYFAVLHDMHSAESAISVVKIVEQYIAITDQVDNHIKTLALVFLGAFGDPKKFAEAYWRFVQKVHDVDSLKNEWDSTVSSNPAASDFELSIAGRAMFTTTLNPSHPRVARRFSYPLWVCNQTRQFDRLRELALFDKWKEKIRADDAAVDPSGVSNPLLSDHGSSSAATQLAGWPVEPCPLRVHFTVQERQAAGLAVLEELVASEAPADLVNDLRQRLSACGTPVS